MAHQADLFDLQYSEIFKDVSRFHGQVIEETSKRVIARFAHDTEAQTCAYSLKTEGFRCAIRRGKRTRLPYLQVLLNSPF